MQIDFMSDPHYPQRHDDMDAGVCNHTGGLFKDLDPVACSGLSVGIIAVDQPQLIFGVGDSYARTQ